MSYNLYKNSSNALTRLYSRLSIPLFDKDAAKMHKYQMSILNSLVDLGDAVGGFNVSILGSSGESIFKSIQYLSSALRQIKTITSILNNYVAEIKKEEEKLIGYDQELLEISKIIDDFNLNKLNFDFNETAYFSILQNLIDKYKSGDSSVEDQIVKNYRLLLSSLSKDIQAKSLSEIFEKRLKATAGVSGKLKSFFGKLIHNVNIFDKTSAIRLDAHDKGKEISKLINDLLDSLEKSLEPFEIFNILSEIDVKLTELKQIVTPLTDIIKGLGYGEEFIKMIEKNQLTDYPVDFSDKEKKTFENYLNRKDFRDLLKIYNN